LGKKGVAQEAIVMKDPDTNIELTNSKSIRNAALHYSSNLLQNRDPKPEFSVDINAKELLIYSE